jgi:hypothetical protein
MFRALPFQVAFAQGCAPPMIARGDETEHALERRMAIRMLLADRKVRTHGALWRLWREASRATWRTWGDRAMGLQAYSVGATGVFFAWFQRTDPFWVAAYQSVAAAAAALVLLMICIFIEELGKAPSTLRKARVAPPSIEMRITIRNDRIHENVLELDREILDYEQYRNILGHGRQSTTSWPTKRLAKLNKRIEQFGVFLDHATFEDGTWRRRRTARKMYSRIREVKHTTDLAILKQEIGLLRKTW